MSEELKPCPFCAGKPEIHTQMVSRYQFVSCSTCRCDGPLKERTRDAIACWNRRASPTPEGQVEERISGERAKKAAQRLINSHFGNADPARVSIPAQPTDDDLTIMAYIEQAEARRAPPTPERGEDEAFDLARQIITAIAEHIDDGDDAGAYQIAISALSPHVVKDTK